MRRLLFIAAAVLALVACSKENEDVLQKQRERMVQYLESTHSPRLVAEAAVESGTEQPFYTTFGTSTYRYIDGYYNPDRASRTIVTEQSAVTITFSAYAFNFQNIQTDGNRVTMPFYSNDPLLKELFFSEEVGLTPGAWDFEPLVIDLKHDELLKGLRQALIGCRERDRVEVYMTYNAAYGNDYMNTVEKEQPIAYFFTVKAVE